MNKIKSVFVLMLFVFGLFLINPIYAEDIEEQVKFGLTEESLKIKLTMLESVIDQRIEQTEYIITKISELDSSLDVSILNTEVNNLNSIKERVRNLVNSNLTREELLEKFYEEKDASRIAISNIREFFLNNVALEDREPICDKFRAERKSIQENYKAQINVLKEEHNTKIRLFHRESFNELNKNVGQKRAQINKEFKNRAQEIREQRNIEQKLYKNRMMGNRQMR